MWINLETYPQNDGLIHKFSTFAKHVTIDKINRTKKIFLAKRTYKAALQSKKNKSTNMHKNKIQNTTGRQSKKMTVHICTNSTDTTTVLIYKII
jgi:hypothetical protein